MAEREGLRACLTLSPVTPSPGSPSLDRDRDDTDSQHHQRGDGDDRKARGEQQGQHRDQQAQTDVHSNRRRRLRAWRRRALQVRTCLRMAWSRSLFQAAEEGTGKHAHDEHQPAQGTAAPIRCEQPWSSPSTTTRASACGVVDSGAGCEAPCHAGVDEAGAHHEHPHALIVQRVAETLGEGVQAGLGRSVDDVRAPVAARPPPRRARRSFPRPARASAARCGSAASPLPPC